MSPDQAYAQARTHVTEVAAARLEASPLYGRENALAYAFGYVTPTGDDDAVTVALLRGVLDGLEHAGVFGPSSEQEQGT